MSLLIHPLSLLILPNELLFQICKLIDTDRRQIADEISAIFGKYRISSRTVLSIKLVQATATLSNIGRSCKRLYCISTVLLYGSLYFVESQRRHNNCLARTILTTSWGDRIKQIRCFGDSPVPEFLYPSLSVICKNQWQQSESLLLLHSIDALSDVAPWKARCNTLFWDGESLASLCIILSKAKHLERLRIRYPDRKGPFAELFRHSNIKRQKFTELKNVEIYNPGELVRAIDDLSHIYHLPKLEILILNDFQGYMQRVETRFPRCPTLKRLVMWNANIRTEDFVHLIQPSLEEVFFRYLMREWPLDTDLAECLILFANSLPQLRLLHIDGYPVTPPSATSIQYGCASPLKALTSLQELGIHKDILPRYQPQRDTKEIDWSYLPDNIRKLYVYSVPAYNDQIVHQLSGLLDILSDQLQSIHVNDHRDEIQLEKGAAGRIARSFEDAGVAVLNGAWYLQLEKWTSLQIAWS
jgi:hypothetical protein